MGRSSDMRAWRVAKTMLQELEYLWRWRSEWRVMQKLFSDGIVGLPNVDHERVCGQYRNGRENERYRQHATHRSNENKMSDGGRWRAARGMGVWKSSQM
jgi:hypothetical protein